MFIYTNSSVLFWILNVLEGTHRIYINQYIQSILNLIKSYLTYCLYSWGSTSQSNLKKLLIKQTNIIRMLMKAECHAPSKPLFDKLNTMTIYNIYSTNHVYLHRPNAFGFWQTRLHLCYETLKRVSNFSELA